MDSTVIIHSITHPIERFSEIIVLPVKIDAPLDDSPNQGLINVLIPYLIVKDDEILVLQNRQYYAARISAILFFFSVVNAKEINPSNTLYFSAIVQQFNT